MLYRVKSGKCWVGREAQRVGSLVELSEAQALSFGDVVEPAGGNASLIDVTAVQDESPRHVLDRPLSDLHWAEAAKYIRESESAGDVTAWRDEESAGKARKSVLEAAETRLSELEG